MTDLYRAIADCRLCYGRALTEVLDIGEQALGGIFPKSAEEDVPYGPLKLLKCGDCGLVQLAQPHGRALRNAVSRTVRPADLGAGPSV